jgi:hypothetical protein
LAVPMHQKQVVHTILKAIVKMIDNGPPVMCRGFFYLGHNC